MDTYVIMSSADISDTSHNNEHKNGKMRRDRVEHNVNRFDLYNSITDLVLLTVETK